MFKHHLTQINQFHKSRGALVLGLALSVVLIASGIAGWASMKLDIIARTGLIRVSIDSGTGLIPVTGSGVDILNLPTTNLLKDASFEPYTYRTSLAVEDGTKSVIIVSNVEAQSGKFGEGFYTGGDARITTHSDTDIITKKSAKVIRYSPDRIAEFNLVPIRGDVPIGSRILDIAVKDDTVVAVGDKGIIITGINSQSPVIEFSGVNSDLIGVCSNSGSFFACTAEGVVIASADGSVWESWISPENISLNSIAASDEAVVAVGDGGRMIIGTEGSLYSKNLNIDDDISDIIYAEDRFIAVTSAGRILASANGINWSTIAQFAGAYTRIGYSDIAYVLQRSDGYLDIYADIGGVAVTSTKMSSQIADIAVVSKTKILALDIDGNILETKDLGQNWAKSGSRTPEICTLVRTVKDGEIICSANIHNTYVSRLVTEIELDSELQSGVFQAGDFCYLTIDYPDVPTSSGGKQLSAEPGNPWEHYGSGSAQRLDEPGAPSGGTGIMKITAGSAGDVSEDDYSVISQKITADQTGTGLSAGGFYIFSIWIRQDTLSEGSVKVWLSGDYSPLGTEFTDIGTGWSKYTYKFSIPRSMTTGQAGSIRINIGTAGEGVYYFDKAYLGLASEKESSVPADYRQLLSGTSPLIVRTGFLNIGTEDVSSNLWSYNGSIDTAMRLVLESGEQSAPWIIIDSYTPESELRNLIEYLSGPISSPYGNLRLSNGSSLPWSTRFEKIYIEFTDNNDLFKSDISRALYVDYSISVIESSPYYKNIRSGIVLIDGMKYAEGLMLSKADYSSLDFVCDMGENTLVNLNKELDRYASLIPRNPDRPSDTPINIMKSLTFTDGTVDHSAADYAILLLDSLGKYTTATFATLDSISASDVPDALAAAAAVASEATQGDKVALKTEILNKVNSNISCYAFNDGDNLYFVFASHDNNPVAIKLETQFPRYGAQMTRYDASGNISERRSLKSSGERFNIMPGNIVLIKIVAGSAAIK
ncbi:MAG: carbohydrate binding domain-containing protein [Saccharofermentanales bacterium]